MEELKLILETISALGIEAKWAFFVWIAYKTLIVIVVSGSSLLALRWAISAMSNDATDGKKLRAISHSLGLDYYQDEKIIDKIAELKVMAAKATPPKRSSR